MYDNNHNNHINDKNGNPGRDIPYDREKAVRYADEWALKRNPAYLNFAGIGGDCTNFVSQCLHAGCGTQNYTPDVGWYYNSSYDRAAAWSGVTYLRDFLVKNKGAGPYAAETGLEEAEIGDILQLAEADGVFHHSLLVVETEPELKISCHSYDAARKPLSEYDYSFVRCLHILGVRK